MIIYIDCCNKYQEESLKFFGIDGKKIIKERSRVECIQADELIVPLLPARKCYLTFDGYKFEKYLGFYCSDWVLKELRNIFLPLIQDMKIDFSKKIFISRQDAPHRKVENEDEVFKLFEDVGFKRYVLSEMSLFDQVFLFYNADEIVQFQGSACTNLIFCKEKTKVVEIFQGRFDITCFGIVQQLVLEYDCIKTIDFLAGDAHENTVVPLPIIRRFLEQKKMKDINFEV